MGKPHTPESRARISRGVRRWWEVRKRNARVTPLDLVQLREVGTVAPSIVPLMDLAQQEAVELGEALGSSLSPQREMLVRDLVTAGLLARVLARRFLQSDAGDPDFASKIGSLLGQRRSSLQALGLERVAKEINFQDYVRDHKPRQDRSGAANEDSPVLDVEPEREVSEDAT